MEEKRKPKRPVPPPSDGGARIIIMSETEAPDEENPTMAKLLRPRPKKGYTSLAELLCA